MMTVHPYRVGDSAARRCLSAAWKLRDSATAMRNRMASLGQHLDMDLVRAIRAHSWYRGPRRTRRPSTCGRNVIRLPGAWLEGHVI